VVHGEVAAVLGGEKDKRLAEETRPTDPAGLSVKRSFAGGVALGFTWTFRLEWSFGRRANDSGCGGFWSNLLRERRADGASTKELVSDRRAARWIPAVANAVVVG
jgi:hypothetical protein